MKKLIIIVFVCFPLISIGQGFQVIPTDKDLDTSSLKKPLIKVPTQKKNNHSYLSPEERDVILSNYIPSELKQMDESERDILYKSLLQYDKKRLEKKYPFLKKVKIDELKKSL